MAGSDGYLGSQPRDDEWQTAIVGPRSSSSRSSSTELSGVIIQNRSLLSAAVAIKRLLDGEGEEITAATRTVARNSMSSDVAPGKKATIASFISVENRNKFPVRVKVSLIGMRQVSEALDDAAVVNPELGGLSSEAKDALVGALSTTESLEQGIEQAAASNLEVNRLSQRALEDLRLALVLSKPHEEREVWIAAITWQSAEAVGGRLALATWGLVAATAMLFLATVALIFVTAFHN